MKQLKLIALLLLLIYCCNCSKLPPGHGMLDYMLLIDITNVSGEKILKDIPRDNSYYLSTEGTVPYEFEGYGDLLHEMYTWEIVAPESFRDWVRRVSTEVIQKKTVMAIKGEGQNVANYYLEVRESSPYNLPPQSMIMYKMTCPYIFGDDEEHVIVTYWKPREDDLLRLKAKLHVKSKPFLSDDSYRNYCYRIIIDGEEFPVTQEPLLFYLYDNSTGGFWDTVSVAWVVLDN